jgi:hypothetical protein
MHPKGASTALLVLGSLDIGTLDLRKLGDGHAARRGEALTTAPATDKEGGTLASCGRNGARLRRGAQQ